MMKNEMGYRTMNVTELLQRRGGVFSQLRRVESNVVGKGVHICTVRLGNIARLRCYEDTLWRATCASQMGASGTSTEPDKAMLLALAEGLERYSACMASPEQLVWSTADELGESALDLDTIPKCSLREFNQRNCPLRAPSKQEPIRWVRGLSLMTGCVKWIPATLVYLRLDSPTPAERIALSITTGCAAHVSYQAAVLAGLCEVIERDLLSVLWLQRLPLDQLEFPDSDSAIPIVSNCSNMRATHLHVFDGTTDLGVPIRYVVRHSPSSVDRRLMVTCSAHPVGRMALEKAITDIAPLDIALRVPKKVPQDPVEFKDVLDGAIYMASAKREHAFSFLLHSGRRRIAEYTPEEPSKGAAEHLVEVISRLTQGIRDVFVVDLTTDEARRCGFRVVRVIVPGLQPLSFNYRARYLDHPRLYELPKLMGFTSATEADLNPWPQPFG